MLLLHEAWYEIAKRIAKDRETWICNAAEVLYYRERKIEMDVFDAIVARVEIERARQIAAAVPNRPGSFGSLWPEQAPASSPAGKIARIRFIASELRRLA